ncbi:hypothetical protein [Paenilisteria newyorkensis]|uniref:hypothetical protein n=1 Tax=Listeria newyorkensis TaxID=1497681 RepID=UPI00066A009F|nr:hypothetical protein [Listeria newyorkensis]KMT63632.1 hypothetical protein X559_0023 [Listeria newyorkensis]
MPYYLIIRKSKEIEDSQDMEAANEIHAAQAYIDNYPLFFNSNGWIKVGKSTVSWGIGHIQQGKSRIADADGSTILDDLAIESTFTVFSTIDFNA